MQTGNGTVSPSTNQTVTCGGSLTLTLSPSSGYTGYLGFYDGGLHYYPVTLTNNSYTLTNIYATYTAYVSFYQTYSTPPTVPTNVSASAYTSSQVNLSWTASTESVPNYHPGYIIYRNGIRVGANNYPYFNDFFLSPSTEYTYTVSAIDFVGNISAKSSPVTVTTPAAVTYPQGSPELDFSDLVTGPNTGNTDTSLGQTSGVDGAIVTIWGKNLGSTQGSSQVLFNGTSARVYSWGNAIAPANLYARHHMQMIIFQIPGSAPITGSGITVVVNGQTSNPLPFTVSTGHIYYISILGNDNNPGIFLSPWQTLIKARNVAAPGDIFYAENGVSQTTVDPDNTDWSTALLLTSSGTYQQPVALIAYPGATVTIGSLSVMAGMQGGESFWVFSRLNLMAGQSLHEGQLSTAEAVSVGDGGRVVGNYVMAPLLNSATGAVVSSGIGSNIFILGNEMTQVGIPGAQKQTHVVYLSSNRTNSGPQQPESANHEVGWNYFHDNYAPRTINIYSEDALSAFLSGNKVHDNIIINQEGGGMLIGRMITGNNWYYNNVVANAGLGPEPFNNNLETHIGVELDPAGVAGVFPQTDLYFYNNTVYGCGFSQAASGTTSEGNISILGTNSFNLHFYNNIIYSTGNPYLATASSDSTPLGQFGNNIWFGDGAAPSWDSSSYSINPGFEDPSNFDFHLTQDSTAAEDGNSLVSDVVTKDFDSTPLPDNNDYNIGAYMYSAASLPVVSFTSPWNGDTFIAGSNLTMTITASEVNGTIANISLYNSSNTLLGSSRTSPYYYNLTNLPAGTTTYYAVASDANGNTMTSSTMTVNVVAASPTLPTVAITAPANNSNYSPGSNVTITATPSESSGSIFSTAIYNQYGFLLGASNHTGNPYSYNYVSAPAGTYIFSATATDANGNAVTSSPITITVGTAPSITEEPVSATVIAPATATFSVIATGNPAPTYQWWQSVNNGVTFNPISGATSATYTTGTTTEANSGTQYECEVTNAVASIISNVAILTVVSATMPSPVVNITSPSNNSSFSAGTSVPIVTTASESGGTIANIKFYNSLGTLQGSGSTSPYTYNTDPTLPAGTYTYFAVATDTNNFSTTSNNVTITLTTPTYTITASAGSNGTINPSGPVSVNSGSSQTFTLTPNTGYVASLTIDGSAVTLTNNTYTLPNVTANHTVVASFALQTETLTVSAGSNGTITPAGSVSVSYGSSQTFTLTPSSGYNATLTVDGTAVTLTNNTFPLTNITATHTLEASFTAQPASGPSVPTGLTATAVSSSQIDLTWTPSSDNTSTVTYYNIYRGGVKIGTVVGSASTSVTPPTSYNDSLLSPSTTYSYYVTVGDAAGNYGGASSTVTATTQASSGPVGGSGGWNLTFSDEFNGSNLNTSMWNTHLTWGYGEGGTTQNGYWSGNVSENAGQLQLELQQQTMTLGGKSYNYTSGMIQNAGNFKQAYGYFEMRARFPVGTGFWPGFWLLPDPTANGAGASQYEIDAIELYKPTDSVQPYGNYTLHWGSNTQAQGSIGANNPNFADGNFHDIAIDWEPGSITWYMDGVATYQVASSNVPSLPMYILATFDLGANGSSAGGPTVNTPIPSTMDIQYIRVYSKATSGGCYSAIPAATDPIPNANCTSAPARPTVPSNLTATALSSSQINLSWSASTESGGSVTGYNIFRNGVFVGTSTNTSYADTGLSASTTYSYAVSAYDPSGNISVQTSTVSATTQVIITASAGTGGSISPSGAVSVNYGANQYFTVTSNSGYVVNQVLVDGSPVTLTNYQYELANVTTSHTISVSYTASTSSNSQVTATVGLTPVLTIPSEFVGISEDHDDIAMYEGQQNAGVMYQQHTGVNTPYRQLFLNLTNAGANPLLLRVEGDPMAPTTTIPNCNGCSPFLPQSEILESLKEFAASNPAIRFTLGVDMASNTPDYAAQEIQNYLSYGFPSGVVQAYEIGNEPDNYPSQTYRPNNWTAANYISDWNIYNSDIATTTGNNNLPFMGPSTAGSSYESTAISGLGSGGNYNVSIYSQHHYVLGSYKPGNLLPAKPANTSDPWNAPDELLEPNASAFTVYLYSKYISQAKAQNPNLKFRIGEMNSISGGGQAGISDAFQSTLWLIDDAFNLAQAGFDGFNFHTGESTAYNLWEFKYSPNVVNNQDVYVLNSVNAPYYGMLVLSQVMGNGAKLLPVTTGGSTPTSLKVWATLNNAGVVQLVIINKDEHNDTPVQITVPGYTAGTASLLTAPSYTSSSGITLGGQTFDGSTDGTIQGTQQSYSVQTNGSVFTIDVPMTSAVIMQLTAAPSIITASAGAGGAISPSGSVSVNNGSSQSFTVTANTGYNVNQVLVDGNPVTLTNGQYTFTNVTTAHTITASFSLQTETITASEGTGGAISPSGAVSVNYGASQTFTVTPNAGYTAILTVDGNAVTLTNNTYILSNVTATHTVAASFSLLTETISASAGTGGTISPSGTVTVNYGYDETFTVTPSTGYSVNQVLVDGQAVSLTNGQYTFTNVIAPHTIATSFTLHMESVTASAGSNGTITPSGSVSVNYGASQIFTLTPNTGYTASLTVDGSAVTLTNDTYTLSNVTAAHTVVANFALPITIIANAGNGGMISPSGAVSINSGASQAFAVTANSGYNISWVLVDGSAVSLTNGSYSFTNVTTAHTITALFSPQSTETITSTAGTGGTITPSGSVSIAYGASQKFTVTPNSGYMINQVLVNGTAVALDSSNSYTITYVIPEQTITAGFSALTTPANVALTPSSNIQTAVNANPAGTIFTLGAGIYRMLSITPKSNDIFIGSGEGSTVLNGSQVLSFQLDPQGSGYWVASATANNSTNGTCQTAYPLCAYPQDLFINNALQTPASSMTNLQAGSWYFDRTNNLVYVPSNPSGQTVELGMTPVAFGGTASATGVKISQMTIEKYANLAQHAAIGDNNDPQEWTVNNVELAWNHGNGVGLGAGSLIENSFLHNNGQEGFTFGGANDTLTNNEISFNNYAGYATGWEAGAGKSWATTNLTVKSNYVHDNLGVGLWTDNNNVGTLYDSNTVINNLDAGIQHEISYDAIIRNNFLDGNGYDTSFSATMPTAFWNAQIVLGNSQNAQIYGNTVVVSSSGGHGIGVINESRGTGTLGIWYGANDYIHNNSITYLGSGAYTGVVDYLGGNTAVGDLFDYDQYVLQNGGSQHWFWYTQSVTTFTQAEMTWAQFQNSGEEVHGSNIGPVVQNTLTLTEPGPGSGTITSVPAGIYCGSTCTASFNSGVSVVLTAVAKSGSVFSGWSGACSGTGSCTVTMNSSVTVTATFVPNTTFTITASAGSGGRITPTTTTVAYGGSQTFTVTPGAGYTASVTLDGSVVTLTNNTYTLNNVTAVHTLAATFTLQTETITVNAGTGGTISPSGAVSVNYGYDETFTVTPATGYSVNQILVDGQPVTLTNGQYTFTNVITTHTITASFSQITYTVTATAGSNGSISPTSVSVTYGGSQLFTLTPSPGYTASLKVDGSAVTLTNNTYNLSNVTATHALVASFTQNTYAITASAGSNGSITPTSAIVAYGGSQLFTLTPATGYTASLTVDGTPVTLTNNTYTLSNVTAVHTLVASFTQITFAVTASAGRNGSISPLNATVVYGGSQVFTLTPVIGYTAKLTVDGTAVTLINNSYTLSNVTATHTLVASFIQNTYAIIASAGSNGSISPTSVTVAYGGSQLFTLTPSTGYTASLRVDGSIVTLTNDTYTLSDVTATHTLTASFTQNTYAIAASAGSNGSITPTSATVAYGGSQIFTVTPNTGYSAQLTVDGTPVTLTNNAYTLSSVTATHTLAASFSQETYAITAGSGANGSISPTSATVAYGGSQVFTVTPDTGYSASLTVDGSAVALTNNTYTLSNVTATHTLRASFSQNTYTITASTGSNGSITPTSATVAYGGSQLFTLTPSLGYTAILKVDGSAVTLTNNTYTLSNVTATHALAASFSQNTYVITASAGSNGSITPTSSTVAYGGSQLFTLTPATGYSANLTLDGTPVTLANNSYTISNVTAPHTLAASFTQNTYSITASAGSNGSITPTSATVAYGGSQAFNITASTGYTANVTDNGIAVNLTDNTYVLNNVTTNHAIAVSFVLQTRSITASAGTGGSIIPSGVVGVNYGSNQIFTVTPATGYNVDQVLVDGQTVTLTNGQYTFTDVTTTHTVVASFIVQSEKITASAGDNGSISPLGAVVLNYGTNQTYAVTPDVGYNVNQILVDGQPVTLTNGQYTFTNVTTAHTIAASFVLQTRNITASAGVGGSISPSGVVSTNYGSDQSFTVTVNAGYNFNQVLVDGEPVTLTNGQYMFSNVTASHTIAVSFLLQTRTITASASTGGSISRSGAVSANFGSNQTFTVTPAIGYNVDQVLVDGQPVTLTNGQYTFTNVTTSHTIAASFILQMETITASADDNGSIGPSGTVSLNYGSNQTFTVTPDTGYNVNQVLVDGKPVILTNINGQYSFTNVTTSHTIAVNFVLQTKVITATAGSGGSISPSGPVNVNYDSNQTFTFTPNGEYTVNQLLVDGQPVTLTNGQYTFPDVVSAHTIAVSFTALTTYTLNATGSNGTVTANPSQTNYNPGVSVTLTATAASGYQFSSWSGDVTGSSNPVTVVMNSNMNVTANFVPIYSLNVISPNGTVTITPNQASYVSGTAVTLTATPANGYQFSSWSGDVTAIENPVTATMNSNMNVVANYIQILQTGSIVLPTSTASSGGSSGVSGSTSNTASNPTSSVTSSPASGSMTGFVSNPTSNPTPSSASSPSKSPTPSPTPSPTTNPTVSSTTNTTTVPETSPATSSTPPETVSYALYTFASNGTVLASPDEASYAPGTVVTLTAIPASGYRFSSWSIDASGTSDTVRVTMNSNKIVIPKFIQVPVKTYSLWDSASVPGTVAVSETSPIEIGLKFNSHVAGYVSGVRFYKSKWNTGIHRGHLWSVQGRLLGSVTFTKETSQGWQQAMFSTAIPVVANRTYIVSYNAPHGRYTDDEGYFAQKSVANTPLYALRNNSVSPNGVYAYGSGGFPNKGQKASNYWVDLVFTASK